ncbi:MAG: M20/M25/M40 family metallo-hydrolase [Xanthomonadales bacterium]|jgi:glutamate carboxypeptidase|nr:M20/M25/M40 family metallo-hydrolase [Xanthomonadales bacterium]
MDYSKLRREVIAFIDAHEKEQLEFLVRLCDQNSYSFNPDGVNKVGEMIVDNLNGIMPVHEVETLEKVGRTHIFRSSEHAKSIYLLGHMDTVFPPEHAFQACSVNGDVLAGPGTGDMKGGLVVIIYALKALHHAGVLRELKISTIFNSDEEIGSKYSRPVMERERERAAMCLVTECAGLDNQIVISRNGKMGARMSSFGKPQHVSVGNHEKSSAILEAARKIIDIEALNAIYPGVSLNVGKVSGGLGPATIAAEAEAYVDIRWEHEEHKDRLIGNVQSIVAQQALAGCHSEFEVLNWRPSMPYTGRNRELIDIIQSTAGEIGQQVPAEHRRGSSDANYFGSAGVPTVDGLGPISQWDHTADEYISIPSLHDRTRLLASVLLRLGESAG